MIDALLDPAGWQIVAAMVAALVSIAIGFVCVHWGMWRH